jgi:uncharacterized protein (TIGR00725 family)
LSTTAPRPATRRPTSRASECDRSIARLAHEVGRRVAGRGAVVLNGGRGGVMEASAQGAHEAGGLTIGLLKGTDRRESRANPYIDVALRTGLGDARNWINVSAADGLIAISGGWGTLSEIALARKIGKPVVLLRSWRLQAHQPGVEPLPTAETAEEAVDRLFEMIDSAGSEG